MTGSRAGGRGPVIVDTGIFAAELVRKGALLAESYRPLLEGRPYIISFVTVAEVKFGAELAGWGSPRLQRIEHRIGSAQIVWPGPELVAVYASLRARCVRDGHGLGQKVHEVDRWVAATAIWLNVPLVAHDSVFKNVPRLSLETRLGSETA